MQPFVLIFFNILFRSKYHCL